MAQLAEAGIEAGVVMMPILPFIEDSPENIESIVLAAAAHRAAYIIPSFGVTVREGQREHFYHKLDEQFPGVRQQYEGLSAPVISALPGIPDNWSVCSLTFVPVTRLRPGFPPILQSRTLNSRHYSD